MPSVSQLTQLNFTPVQSRHLGFDMATGLTATGNASQAGAYQLTANHNQFTVVTGANNSAKLPSAAAAPYGAYFVSNDDAADDLNLYPATGESINGLAANAAIVIPFGASAIIVRASESLWLALKSTNGAGYQPLDATLTSLAALAIVQGDLIYGSGADAVSRLAKSTTATHTLLNTGTNNNPAWGKLPVDSGVSGVLPVANGGLNLSTVGQGDILYGDDSTHYAKLSKDTNATRYISNGGTNNNPAWAQINALNGIALTGSTWTPTYEATGGPGNMSYGSVTTYIAVYFQIGKLVIFYLSAEGTTAGTAEVYITFTLPVTGAAFSDSIAFWGTAYDASGNHTATAVRAGTTTLGYVPKSDNSNWGIGANRAFRCGGIYLAA